MGKQMNITDQCASARQIALILGMTAQSLGKILKDDAIKANKDGHYVIGDIVQHYISRVRHNSADAETLARIRGLEAKASLAEIELAKQQQSLITISDATLTIGGSLSAIRSQLLAIPSKVAPQVVGLTAPEIEDELKKYIHELLNELSSIPQRLENLDIMETEETDVQDA